METVLIVEDDRVYARATTNWLVKNGINARYVLSVNNAKEFLDNHDVDLVLSDFRLDNGNGMELLEWMNTHGYRIPFLIMTGYGDIPGAVEAVKKGVVDYLPKPVQTEKVLGIIRKALERKRRDGNTKQRFYTSKSPLALRLQEHIRLVAPVDTLAVLIRGASGTGKEYVARQIHVLSGRSDASFDRSGLRGASEGTGGIGTVRSCEGGLYRSDGKQDGHVCRRQPWDTVSGRSGNLMPSTRHCCVPCRKNATAP